MYKFIINDFEGPLDLLLHLIKESNVDIVDIEIEQITKQYLNYIKTMEQMNLDIASEYLVMAAELIEMKSKVYLPVSKIDEVDEYQEDSRENLINRLLEYQKYKEATPTFKELENNRKDIHTIPLYNLSQFNEKEVINELPISVLLDAFNNLLSRKEKDKPLNTRITKKEYSLNTRSNEIREILKRKKKIEFEELFDIVTKEYIVITFLSILDLAHKQEIVIEQGNNFNKIYLLSKENV